MDVYNKNLPQLHPRRRGRRPMTTRKQTGTNAEPGPDPSHPSYLAYLNGYKQSISHMFVNHDIDSRITAIVRVCLYGYSKGIATENKDACRSIRDRFGCGIGTLRKRANEPNGSLDEICRSFGCGSRPSLATLAKRANEANGGLDKICRLSNPASRQVLARRAKRRNEPNGSLGRICRLSDADLRVLLVVSANRANEPNVKLNKIDRLHRSSRRPSVARAKQRNKAISVIANGGPIDLACIHLRQGHRPALGEIRGTGGRVDLTSQATRPDRSDPGREGVWRGGLRRGQPARPGRSRSCPHPF